MILSEYIAIIVYYKYYCLQFLFTFILKDADSDANYLDIGRSSAGSYSRPRGVSLTAPPSQIIFRGNRLVPACLVDEKRNDIQDILEEIEELEKAVS